MKTCPGGWVPADGRALCWTGRYLHLTPHAVLYFDGLAAYLSPVEGWHEGIATVTTLNIARSHSPFYKGSF